MQDASPSPATKQDWAKAKGTFRVVNQNTLSNGLADAERGPKFKRLFAAINADAYCFQEEWKQDQFQTGTAHTWRGLKADESFWPGRLDLVSTTGFQAVNGKVFDTGRLAEAELEKLGVEKTDSFASDHLMLVVDCELR